MPSLVSNRIGISVSTGTFLAGVLVAESGSPEAAHRMMSPLKELFGATFFVSIGALMDLHLLPFSILPILAFLATAIGVKVAASCVAARRLRMAPESSPRTAVTVSASGGELSIVVAKGGTDIGSVGSSVLPFIGAMTIVTTVVSSYLVR